MTAVVSYAAVGRGRNAACDELSLDARTPLALARAPLGRTDFAQQGRPASFLCCAWPKKGRFVFAPAYQNKQGPWFSPLRARVALWLGPFFGGRHGLWTEVWV